MTQFLLDTDVCIEIIKHASEVSKHVTAVCGTACKGWEGAKLIPIFLSNSLIDMNSLFLEVGCVNSPADC